MRWIEMGIEIAGFKAIGVVGGGQMGAGIAQVCATHGLQTVLVDVSDNQLQKAKSGIEASLEKLAGKNVIDSASRERALEALTFKNDMQALAGCDLIVEAITENERVKVEVFQKIDKITPATTIFASNTSSIPITRLAAATSRPGQFIGMHFMNPVPLMKLVEIIPGMTTSEETTRRILDLAHALGKETSRSADYPGFVVNRILMPMINEAFNALMEGVASAEDIDKGMKLGTNQPMGPLTLADFIGLDTCLAIMRVLHDGLGDPRYRPSPLLVKHVEAGWLGRKSKRGVYSY
jgi:3-hydroxybutyryl-CoA dehydrogenase